MYSVTPVTKAQPNKKSRQTGFDITAQLTHKTFCFRASVLRDISSLVCLLFLFVGVVCFLLMSFLTHFFRSISRQRENALIYTIIYIIIYILLFMFAVFSQVKLQFWYFQREVFSLSKCRNFFTLLFSPHHVAKPNQNHISRCKTEPFSRSTLQN